VVTAPIPGGRRAVYDVAPNGGTIRLENPRLHLHLPLDSGSGGVTPDTSGSGHDGGLAGGRFVTDRVAGSHALALDGVADQVSLPAIALGGAGTLAAWVRVSAAPAEGEVAALLSRSGGADGLYLRGVPGGVVAELRVAGATYGGNPGDTPLAVGSWHHLAGSYDAGSAHLYVDGREVASGARPAAGPDPSAPWTLGAAVVSGAVVDHLAGTVDEVSLWGRALGAQEVLALVARDGPAGLWRFSESRWDGVPGEVADASGLGNSGTALAGAQSVTGAPVGRGARFDGIDDRIALPAVPLGPGGATLAAWVKPDGLPATGKDAVFLGRGNPAQGLALRRQGSQLALVYRSGDATLVSTRSADLLRRGTWYHVAASDDGTTARLYLDGRLIAESPVSAAHGQAHAPWSLGSVGAGDPLAVAYKGVLDEVGLWSRPLGAGEIEALRGASSLRAQWAFEEERWPGVALEVQDSSGQGRHGRAFGGAVPVASGIVGRGARLDGVNDRLNLVKVPLGANAGSIAAWFELASLPAPGTFSTIIARGDRQDGLYVDEDGGWPVLLFLVGGNWVASYGAADVIVPGVPRFVVGTFDGGRARLYVDGALVAEQGLASGFGSQNPPWRVGATQNPSAPKDFLHGVVDEVSLWDRALTQEEVTRLFRAVIDR
jgi:hypothetical protein